MPRAVVMMYGTNLLGIRKGLQDNLRTLQCPLTQNTGVILEFYLETFGWPDFLASLWGTNTAAILAGVQKMAEICEVETTTILGILPEEMVLRSEEHHSRMEKLRRSTLGKYEQLKPSLIEDIFNDYLGMQRELIEDMRKNNRGAGHKP